MNADLRDRLSKTMLTLHKRALALSHPNKDHDMAAVMSALAQIIEALGEIDAKVAEVPRMIRNDA